MGGVYSLEFREPFFGGQLPVGIDRTAIQVVDRQAQEWQQLEPLDGPLLCLACREIGHGLQDCTWEGEPPQLQRTQEHCSLADYVHREAIGPSEVCGRCKTLDVNRVFKCNASTTEEISSTRSTGTDTSAFQNFYLSHCTDLKLFLRCALCRLLFTILPVIDRREDLFLDVQTSSARSRFGFEPNGESSAEPAPSMDGIVLAGLSVSRSQSSETYGTGAIGLTSQNVPRSRLGLCAKLVRSRLDVDMITGWIDSCVSTHGSICNNYPNSRVLPLRMIDVQSRTVVKSADLDDVEYICLSYVWGGQRLLKTQTAFIDMPKTIQDAILLVQRLGKRYIWVDALCIDQSNSQEIKSQIEIMDEIYSGALCTIVPLESKNSETGIPFINPNIEIAPQLSANLQDKVLLSLFPALAEVIQGSFWAKRGWIFQEFLLSNRLLFFTSYQVYFQCNITERCQSIDDTNSNVHLNPTANVISPYGRELGPTGATDKPFRKTLRTIVVKDRAEARSGFQRLASAYSALELSYLSDKLRAFAGILNRLTNLHYPTGFYWGLPLSDLGVNLGWDFPWSRKQERLVERIAEFPSWSWAGWNTIITFPSSSNPKTDDIEKGEGDRNESESNLHFWQWTGANSLQPIRDGESTQAGSFDPLEFSFLEAHVRRDHVLGVYGRCIALKTTAYYEQPGDTARADNSDDETKNASVGVRFKDDVHNLYGFFPGTLDQFIGKPYTMLILITEYAAGSVRQIGILMEANGGAFARIARVILDYPILDEQDGHIPIEEKYLLLI